MDFWVTLMPEIDIGMSYDTFGAAGVVTYPHCNVAPFKQLHTASHGFTRLHTASHGFSAHTASHGFTRLRTASHGSARLQRLQRLHTASHGFTTASALHTAFLDGFMAASHGFTGLRAL